MAKTASASSQTTLNNVRKICLELPETVETMTWGNPHFRVKDKIFCGFNDEKGVSKIGFKLEMGHAQAIIEDPRFCPAPYVGHKGWVSMTLDKAQDWQEVRKLVRESYYLIAPKKLAKQMLEEDLATSKASARKTSASKASASKATASKATANKAAASKASASKASASKASASKLRTKSAEKTSEKAATPKTKKTATKTSPKTAKPASKAATKPAIA